MKKHILAIMTLAVALLALPGTVHAAASLRQTKYAASSISVEWDDLSQRVTTPTRKAKVYAYQLVWYDIDGNQVGKTKSLSAKKRSYTIKHLDVNSTYYIRLRFGCYFNGDKSDKKTYALTNLEAFTTPGATEVLKYDHAEDQKGLRVRWEPAAGNNESTRYQYQIVDYKGKQLKKATKSGTILNIKKFKQYNRVCKIRVRPYMKDENGKKHYGTWSEYMNIIPQPVVTMDKTRHGVQDNGTMILKWQRVFGAKEYHVYISTRSSKTGFKRVGRRTANTADSMTVLVPSNSGRSFVRGVTYYVRVVTITEDGSESQQVYTMKIRKG